MSAALLTTRATNLTQEDLVATEKRALRPSLHGDQLIDKGTIITGE
jgi:hypothetical protein